MNEPFSPSYHFTVQGTVIRVFSVPQGEKLVEFRRGMKRSVLDGDVSVDTENKMQAMECNHTDTCVQVHHMYVPVIFHL